MSDEAAGECSSSEDIYQMNSYLKKTKNLTTFLHTKAAQDLPHCLASKMMQTRPKGKVLARKSKGK